MPELPEVETLRRALAPLVEGRSVTGVSGAEVRLRRPLDPEALDKQMLGCRFLSPTRRAKYLLMHTDRGDLLVHLGMSGRFVNSPSRAPKEKHTHLILHLDSGRNLHYVDPRRFGFLTWLPDGKDQALERLGLDPLQDAFPSKGAALLKQKGSPLKNALMDQKLIGGVGNIYANEALWRAGIRPSRRGSQTSLSRLKRLCEVTREVLLEAIEGSGTTLRDHVLPGGEAGGYFWKLDVYGRAGSPCRRCKDTLREQRISQRTTIWCPRCQT